jgi:hypothetical protein
VNLRQHVLDALDETDLVDPREIADHLLRNMPPAQAVEALRETLPNFVRLVIKANRFDRLDRSIPPSNTHVRYERSSRSPKWLRAREYVNKWRMFGDLSVDDVSWLAEDRYHKAKELTVAGDRWTALHELMLRRNVTHVRDLDPNEVEEIFA